MVQDYDACIFFPGSEMPGFIDYQTRGSSIDVTLPAKWRSSSCFGFSICFVAEFDQYHYSKKDFRCDFHLRTKYGESVRLETLLWTCYDNGIKGTQILDSDHVFLCFKYPCSWASACKEADDNNITGMSFHIYALDWVTGSCVLGNSCLIKSCGVRLLSHKDVQEFGLLTNPEYWSSYKEVDGATSKWSEPREIYPLENVEKPNRRERFGSVEERNDHDTPSTGDHLIQEFRESKVEEDGATCSFTKCEPSRTIACRTGINDSAGADEDEEAPTEIEIVPNSAAEVEEDEQSGSGIMELSKTAEKDEEAEDPKSIACGCFLFLSHFKGEDKNIFIQYSLPNFFFFFNWRIYLWNLDAELCEGLFGKKSESTGNELHHKGSSSIALEERLQELEEAVQNLQSENIMLRDQNNQFSQYLQMLTISSMHLASPLLFPMHLPDQNTHCPMVMAGSPTMHAAGDLNTQIRHNNYLQTVTPGHGFAGLPVDRHGILMHPLDQRSQLAWQQHLRMVMSRQN